MFDRKLVFSMFLGIVPWSAMVVVLCQVFSIEMTWLYVVAQIVLLVVQVAAMAYLAWRAYRLGKQ